MSTGNATADAIYQLLHQTQADYAMIGIGAVVFSVNFIVLAFVVWNRKYVPLAMKQIPFVTLSLISKPTFMVNGVMSLLTLTLSLFFEVAQYGGLGLWPP